MNKGHENLIPASQRSKAEARELGKKGGQASGQARRKRKALKESMEILLNAPISNKSNFNKAVKLGFDVENMDNSVLVVVALYEKAATGDVAAIKELRNLIEEDGADTGQLESLIKGLLG